MEKSETIDYIKNKYELFLKNNSQNELHVFIRSLAAYELRMNGCTLPEIGRITKRYHTTVRYYIKNIENKVAHYKHVPAIIEMIKQYNKIEDALTDETLIARLPKDAKLIINKNITRICNRHNNSRDKKCKKLMSA